jgi:hypothetical protein
LYIRTGEAITWTYNVFNIGNVPLTSIVVTDDNGTPADPADDFEVCSIASLEPFANESCSLSGPAIEGQYGNVARVTGTFEDGAINVEDEDAAFYYGVTIALTLEKLTNDNDADEPPGVTLEPGVSITWTYVVSSSSNVMLTEVAVWDDNGTADVPGDDFIVCTIGDLLPSEQVTCEHTGLAGLGLYGNVGTVVASSPLLVDELSTDRSHYVSFIWLYLPLIEAGR